MRWTVELGGSRSPLAQGRGLKFFVDVCLFVSGLVAPRAGAWIEIASAAPIRSTLHWVAPRVGMNTNLKLNHLIKTLRQFRLSSEVNGVVITVKDYQQIRQMHLCGISQRQIARQLHISRNTVAKYCEGCAVPWERKVPERKTPVITDEVVEFIQACLDADEHENLKNQSHTAKTD